MMGLYGSSLGDVHGAHLRGRTGTGSVPRSDTDEETPEFWGATSGDCVSRSGYVRTEHEFLEGWTCLFCDAKLNQDGTITLLRPAVHPRPAQAKPAPPVERDHVIAAVADPLHDQHDECAPPAVEAHAKAKAKKKADEEASETIECPNCAAVSGKFFLGKEILACDCCGFEFKAPDPAPDPERAIPRRKGLRKGWKPRRKCRKGTRRST